MMHKELFRPGRLVAMCLILSSGAATTPLSAQSDAEGRELFTDFQCWQCHGYEAQGGAAARLAGKDYPYEAFVRFVRHPNLMPAYTPEMLSDQQLRLIYDFVRTLPEPPSLDDIPALRE